jgi:hypothetical protein
MGPMAGARISSTPCASDYQVVILSDTFYEFAMPLMKQLGMPTLFCHKLEANAEGFLVNYHLRMPNQKKRSGEGASRRSTSRSSPPAIPTTTPRCWPRPTPASCSARRKT